MLDKSFISFAAISELLEGIVLFAAIRAEDLGAEDVLQVLPLDEIDDEAAVVAVRLVLFDEDMLEERRTMVLCGLILSKFPFMNSSIRS